MRNCLALSKQLVSRFELADDLFGCVPGAFHGEVPGPVWPDDHSHSPWTDPRVSRHLRSSCAPQQLRHSFVPVQLHLQPLDLLEKFSLLGLPLLLVLGVLASAEQLAGTV